MTIARVSIWWWLARGAVMAASGAAVRARGFWRLDGSAEPHDLMSGALHVVLFLTLATIGWLLLEWLRRRMEA